ncbi:MAG: hypothetical protein U1E02_15690, partial [Hydrogenophaga sp.]|nr:hypothetical protein [Hydrogenophaga sp.]
LQKEFGYKQYAKKRGEEKAQTEYLKKLQELASALLSQDQLIDTLYIYVDALVASSKANANNKELIPENSEVLSSWQVSSHFKPKTSTALAIALRYRDLMLDPSLTHTLTEENRRAIFSTLQNHQDPEVQFLGNVIATNYLVDCTSKKESAALRATEKILLFVGEKSRPYLELIKNNAETASDSVALQPFDTFIIKHTSHLQEIPCVFLTSIGKGFGARGIKVYFDKRRDTYTQEQNDKKLLYDATIAEMNTLIQQNPATYSVFAYRLEMPTELLPGINTHILKKSEQSPQNITDILTNLGITESDTPCTKKTKKSKNKPTAAAQ